MPIWRFYLGILGDGTEVSWVEAYWNQIDGVWDRTLRSVIGRRYDGAYRSFDWLE